MALVSGILPSLKFCTNSWPPLKNQFMLTQWRPYIYYQLSSLKILAILGMQQVGPDPDIPYKMQLWACESCNTSVSRHRNWEQKDCAPGLLVVSPSFDWGSMKSEVFYAEDGSNTLGNCGENLIRARSLDRRLAIGDGAASSQCPYITTCPGWMVLLEWATLAFYLFTVQCMVPCLIYWRVFNLCFTDGVISDMLSHGTHHPSIWGLHRHSLTYFHNTLLNLRYIL